MAALTNKQQIVQANRKWIVRRTIEQWVLQERRCGLIARLDNRTRAIEFNS